MWDVLHILYRGRLARNVKQAALGIFIGKDFGIAGIQYRDAVYEKTVRVNIRLYLVRCDTSYAIFVFCHVKWFGGKSVQFYVLGVWSQIAESDLVVGMYFR